MLVDEHGLGFSRPDKRLKVRSSALTGCGIGRIHRCYPARGELEVEKKVGLSKSWGVWCRGLTVNIVQDSMYSLVIVAFGRLDHLSHSIPVRPPHEDSPYRAAPYPTRDSPGPRFGAPTNSAIRYQSSSSFRRRPCAVPSPETLLAPTSNMSSDVKATYKHGSVEYLQ